MQENGKMIVCIDGHFGLVRRKKAGRSAGSSMHGNDMFVRDDTVKSFVESYKEEHGPAQKVNRYF